MKKSIFLIAAIIFFAAGFISSCGDDEKESNVLTVQSVKMSHSKIEVHLGDGTVDSTFVLTYDVVPAKATNIESVSWSSNNANVASVSRSGMVESVSLGDASITVTLKTTNGQSFTDKCDVTVIPPPIGVESVEFETEGQELTVGATVALKPIILPVDATDKSLIWESSNYNIASVDDDGVVKGEKNGTAVITVTTVDGQFKARYNITVVGVAVNSLTIQGDAKLDLEVDDEIQLIANLLPLDASIQTVTWSSSDPAVATVDAEGNVKALTLGTTIITVATTASGHTATCEIEVVKTDLQGVSLETNSDEAKVFDDIYSTRTLTVTYIPANATNKDIASWTSSNTAVAEVDETGKVTFKSTGTVQITVTSDEGGHQSSLDIDVVCYTWIDRTDWWIVGYNDSYNGINTAGPGWSSQATNEGGVDSPNGRVTAMLSDDVSIFWHSSWTGPAEQYPHWFIVDLGEEIPLDAVMLQRRQGNGGTATGYQVYTSTKEDPDIDDPEGGYDWVDRGEYSFNPGSDARQPQALDDENVSARYILMYFDTKYRGSGDNAMFATFGLYRKK